MSYELEGVGPSLPAHGQAWVAPNACLVGRVVLAAGASVWYGAVLRGDNEPITIGENSNIQDNCVAHTDMGFPLTIGAECTIGHLAMVHGCTIGDGALVGIGATILNGAVIGESCIIGAHALIPEGKIIPPFSLVVGAPGRVVRPVTEDEANDLRDGARHYVEQWRRHGGGLAPVGGEMS